MAEVVVVCTGNICRSPLAAAMLDAGLRAVDPSVLISSAGTNAAVGEGVTRNTLRTGHHYGLDLSGHVARQGTAAVYRRAALILVATVSHALEVARVAPGVPVSTLGAAAWRARALGGTTYPLEQWAARLTASIDGRQPLDQTFDIADPIGKSARHYRKSAEQIHGYVDALVRNWCGARPVS